MRICASLPILLMIPRSRLLLSSSGATLAELSVSFRLLSLPMLPQRPCVHTLVTVSFTISPHFIKCPNSLTQVINTPQSSMSIWTAPLSTTPLWPGRQVANSLMSSLGMISPASWTFLGNNILIALVVEELSSSLLDLARLMGPITTRRSRLRDTMSSTTTLNWRPPLPTRRPLVSSPVSR